MQYAVLQAHLWNETLRKIFRSRGLPVVETAGREGPYLFWREIGKADRDALHALRIPTAAAKMDFPDREAEAPFAAVLAEKGLSRSDFRTKELRRVRFQSFLRPAAVVPKKFTILESGPDELHPGREKTVFRFSLPRGSYATMLIKMITLPGIPPRRETAG